MGCCSTWAQQIPADSLLEYSFKLRSINKDSSVALARLVFNQAERNDDQLRREAARVMIGSYYRLSKPDTAIILLSTAASALEAKDFDRWRGLAIWYLGKIHLAYSDYRKATEYFNQALAIFRKQDDAYFTAAVTSDFGILEGKQFNYVMALEYTNQAYEIKVKNGLPADSELNNMAIVYTAMKDFSGARKILWKLIQRQKQDADTASISYTYNTLGSTYSELNKFDSAIFYYKRANDHARWNGNKESQLIALSNLTGAYIKL
jgi:tetratricopeptide (TPR) repeat protein